MRYGISGRVMINELNKQGLSKYINLDRFGLSSFGLKVIAVITMFIDHLAYMFCTGNESLYLALRSIGRISFPIFCFLLVEGFFHTKSRLDYGIRLGVFALISEVPYDMMYGSFFSMEKQNVIFTLFIGFLVIWSLDSISMFKVNYPKRLLKYIGVLRLNGILELAAIIIGLLSAYILNSSYSFAGIMLIMCFYVFHKHYIGTLISNIVFNMGMYSLSIQWWGAVSAIPIAFYNGKKGYGRGKYFFYWFYPLHLCLLVLLRYRSGIF